MLVLIRTRGSVTIKMRPHLHCMHVCHDMLFSNFHAPPTSHQPPATRHPPPDGNQAATAAGALRHPCISRPRFPGFGYEMNKTNKP